MIEAKWQKERLAFMREQRDLPKQGFELLAEGGGSLWEIYRGPRIGQRIVEARVSANGMGVWVKIGPRRMTTPTNQEDATNA